MTFNPPTKLYHETTDEAFKGIKLIGLQPYVGAVVQGLSHYDDEIETSKQGVIFMSDDASHLGYYCLWQTQLLLGKDDIDDVTLEELEAHGVILEINPKDESNEDVIYKRTDDNGYPGAINMRGEKVKSIETEDRETIQVRNLPPSIEPKDYFALKEVTYDRVYSGASLMKLLRKSSNHAVLKLFQKTPRAESLLARIVEAKIKWIMPSWNKEKDEFERMSPGGNYLEWKPRLESAGLVTLTDEIWSKLQNSDSQYADLTMADVKKSAKMGHRDPDPLIKTFTHGGTMEAPIIVHWGGGDYELVAGNTRLMVARVLGVRPQVAMIEFTDEDNRSSLDKDRI